MRTRLHRTGGGGGRRALRVWCLAALVAAAVVPGTSTAGRVFLEPSRIEIASGGSVELRVRVGAAVDSVSCYSLSLGVEPALLDLVDARPGSLYVETPEPTFFNRDVDAQGRDRVSDCVLGFGTTVPTPGELVVLEFEAIADGFVTVSLAEVLLRDVDRLPIDGVVAEPAVVTIGTTSIANPSGQPRLVAWPSPADGTARIRLVAPRPRQAESPTFEIFDSAGRRVRRLSTVVGRGGVEWDGADATGRPVAAGVYHVQAVVDGAVVTTRLVLLR